MLCLKDMTLTNEKHLTEYNLEQVELIQQIHDQLTCNLDRRYSIEDISRQYLINPTTQKNMFKTVYGTSIASHIRQHRMDYAAKLLLTSNSNIAEVARAVGYDSQSRFSAAFKEHFQVLPKDYRRKQWPPDTEKQQPDKQAVAGYLNLLYLY